MGSTLHFETVRNSTELRSSSQTGLNSGDQSWFKGISLAQFLGGGGDASSMPGLASGFKYLDTGHAFLQDKCHARDWSLLVGGSEQPVSCIHQQNHLSVVQLLLT